MITEGELDIGLTSRAMSWLGELEYERIDSLEEETQKEADKARQMEGWSIKYLTRSLWSGDVSLRIQGTSVIVTNYRLEDQLQDLLQRDEEALESRMERFLAHLTREESLKP